MVKKILPLGIPLIALAIILLAVSPAGTTTEKIAGISVSAVLWIIGYSLTKWGEKQNSRILLGVVLGGMLFRIVFVILSIIFVKNFTDLEPWGYIIALMIFYFACEFGLVLDYALRKSS